MKRLSLLVFFLGLISVLPAQILPEGPDTIPRLFRFKKIKSGAYVQFDAGATYIARNAGMTAGVNLGWVLQNRFVVNVLRWEMLTTREDTAGLIRGDYTRGRFVRYSYLGWGLGYIFFANKKFSLHPEINGGINLYPYYPNGTRKTYRVQYGVIIPGIQAVFNAHKHFRIGLFVNYRLTIGGAQMGIPDEYLRGPGGGVFMRVGKF